MPPIPIDESDRFTENHDVSREKSSLPALSSPDTGDDDEHRVETAFPDPDLTGHEQDKEAEDSNGSPSFIQNAGALPISLPHERQTRDKPSLLDDESQDETRTHGKTAELPPLIARFAAKRGYEWNAARGLYVHREGDILRKAGGSFGWEQLSPSGECIYRYWASDQCLAQGVEVPADVWAIIKTHPTDYGMILADDDRTAIEVLGANLIELVENNSVRIFLSKYRLRRIDS